MDLDNDRLVLDVSRSEWDVLIEIQQSLMLLPGGRLRASINLMVSGQNRNEFRRSHFVKFVQDILPTAVSRSSFSMSSPEACRVETEYPLQCPSILHT